MSWAEAKKTQLDAVEKLAHVPDGMRAFSALPNNATSINLTFLEPEHIWLNNGTVLWTETEGVMIRYSDTDYPETPADGTLALDNKELGKYQTTPYAVNGLTEGQNYYFSAFPYSTEGIYGEAAHATAIPYDGERVQVTMTLPEGLESATVKCVDETASTSEEQEVTQSQNTATFFVDTGHTYHVEYSAEYGYVTPPQTESKIASGGGTVMFEATYTVFAATINVTYTEGATCTCSNGDVTLTAADTTGFYAFTVGRIGTWTVKIERADEEPKSTTVEITSNGQTEAVELQFLDIVPWSTGTDEQIAAMLEAHYAGKINIWDYWSIGQERVVHLNSISGGGIAEQDTTWVLMHKGQYPLAGELVDTPVGELPVGTIIQLNENGSPVDYIIVHQGNPDSSMYDASCNGTWVVRKSIAEKRKWNSEPNDSNYSHSDIHSYLNSTYLNKFDGTVWDGIKQVKIPYSNDGTISKLNCKIFLLGGYEVGFTKSDDSALPIDGARLDYFTDASMRRVYITSGVSWWLRSSVASSAFYVDNNGECAGYLLSSTYGVRPAFILDPSFTVKTYPTATAVVGMKDCLNETRAMNSSNTNAGGWDACEMRTWLDTGFKSAVPASFAQIFKKIRVVAANGTGATSVESVDTFALFAEKEVFGTNSGANVTAEATLFHIEWFKTTGNRAKKVNGVAGDYWERSTPKTNADAFCNINYLGGGTWTKASTVFGVSPFGCI